jgi:hypothetical protein
MGNCRQFTQKDLSTIYLQNIWGNLGTVEQLLDNDSGVQDNSDQQKDACTLDELCLSYTTCTVSFRMNPKLSLPPPPPLLHSYDDPKVLHLKTFSDKFLMCELEQQRFSKITSVSLGWLAWPLAWVVEGNIGVVGQMHLGKPALILSVIACTCMGPPWHSMLL